MENQHRIIKGYRELTQAEIDLMNEIKTCGQSIDTLFDMVASHIEKQVLATRPNFGPNKEVLDQPEQALAKANEQARLDQAQPLRWMAMARTDLQVGIMKLIRAVAQPGTF